MFSDILGYTLLYDASLYKNASAFIFNGVEPLNDAVRVFPLIHVQGLYEVFLHLANVTFLTLPSYLLDGLINPHG